MLGDGSTLSSDQWSYRELLWICGENREKCFLYIWSKNMQKLKWNKDETQAGTTDPHPTSDGTTTKAWRGLIHLAEAHSGGWCWFYWIEKANMYQLWQQTMASPKLNPLIALCPEIDEALMTKIKCVCFFFVLLFHDTAKDQGNWSQTTDQLAWTHTTREGFTDL